MRRVATEWKWFQSVRFYVPFDRNFVVVTHKRVKNSNFILFLFDATIDNCPLRAVYSNWPNACDMNWFFFLRRVCVGSIYKMVKLVQKSATSTIFYNFVFGCFYFFLFIYMSDYTDTITVSTYHSHTLTHIHTKRERASERVHRSIHSEILFNSIYWQNAGERHERWRGTDTRNHSHTDTHTSCIVFMSSFSFHVCSIVCSLRPVYHSATLSCTHNKNTSQSICRRYKSRAIVRLNENLKMKEVEYELNNNNSKEKKNIIGSSRIETKEEKNKLWILIFFFFENEHKKNLFFAFQRNLLISHNRCCWSSIWMRASRAQTLNLGLQSLGNRLWIFHLKKYIKTTKSHYSYETICCLIVASLCLVGIVVDLLHVNFIEMNRSTQLTSF